VFRPARSVIVEVLEEVNEQSFDLSPHTRLSNCPQGSSILMLIGIGTDLLHLARLRALLVRRQPHQLAARICSQSELVEWDKSVSTKDTKEMERYLALR
jgi:hypothetical protein